MPAKRSSTQGGSPALTEAFKVLGRIRTRRTRRRVQPKSGMNKTEAQYAAYLSQHPDVVSWKHEPLSLWLAKDCRFIPDFFVEHRDGTLKAVDVKKVWRGQEKPHAEDDALVKLKLAGQIYGDWFAIVMTWVSPQTGTWEERAFEPVEETGKGAKRDG